MKYYFLLLLGLSMLIQPPLLAQNGNATFYHEKFYGRTTSTGETLDAGQYTTASRQYDWGTILRVTNINNGRSVQVRVNDCGPNHPQAILDLSHAAAVELDMIVDGRVPVSVEVVRASTAGPTCNRRAWSRKLKARGKPIPPPPPAWDPATTVGTLPLETVAEVDADRSTTSVSPPLATTTEREPVSTFDPDAILFGVQLGAFRNETSADRLQQRAKGEGFLPTFILTGGKIHRVYAGKFYFQSEAESYRDQLRAAGFKGAVVRRVQ